MRRRGDDFLIHSDAGSWIADSVVVATGHADEPTVPRISGGVHPAIFQLTPERYRNPDDIPDGGVLIVGASASGVQLADELATAGRRVVLAVGRHTRLLRNYRGMDIMWWLTAMGVLDEPLRPAAARRSEPSLQLVGETAGRDVGLLSLAERGIRITGRALGANSDVVTLADDLSATTAAADARLYRLLDRIDQFASATRLDVEAEPPTRPEPSVRVSTFSVPSRLTLHAHGIRSVIWATGYRRRYPWLQLPVLDANGEIRHQEGRTVVPGLVVVGMQRQTRRSSSFIGGVRHDAALIVDHLTSAVLGRVNAGRRAS